jgi:hypothetical protein
MLSVFFGDFSRGAVRFWDLLFAGETAGHNFTPTKPVPYPESGAEA